jgi:RNA polymerase sigma-70 factor (ECF subfamily)
MLAICFALLDDPDDISRFTEIYQKYNVYMAKIAFSILGDEGYALEAVNDALVSMAKHIKKMPANTDKSHEQAYVNLVTRNSSLNILRKNKQDGNVIYLDLGEYGYDNLPETEILSNDVVERISGYIDKMSDVYRNVLRMKYLYDLSVHEISDILELSENTVRSKIRRGTEKLQEIIRSGGIL